MLTKKQLKDAARCCGGLCELCSCNKARMAYQDCIREATKTALAYREMLKQLEWVYNGGAQECPWCQNSKGAGHSDDCEPAALLKEGDEYNA